MLRIVIALTTALTANFAVAQSFGSATSAYLMPPNTSALADDASIPQRLNLSDAVAISSIAPVIPDSGPPVRRIATFLSPAQQEGNHRVVRYDVPLDEAPLHDQFAASGIRGRLLDIAPDEGDEKIRVVRYEVPDDQIMLHSEFRKRGLDGDIVEVLDDRSWRPQVRFLQPKARVFFDLKRDNDAQFDLFRNGSILASLDVLEIYKPLKFVTEWFDDENGKSKSLYDLGWRFGATLGLGITTALANGGGDSGGAPIGVASLGLRYEFPIGPEPPMVLDQGGRPIRLDQRTRVGFEAGLQAGTSTDEQIRDRFDAGFYVGMLVNTPW
ncbi:MAG: hypothetical protein R3C05_16930 [Pirellulaceae bacterium]